MKILHRCFHLSDHTLRLQAHSYFSLYFLSSPQAETSRCHFDHVLFPFEGTAAVSCQCGGEQEDFVEWKYLEMPGKLECKYYFRETSVKSTLHQFVQFCK